MRDSFPELSGSTFPAVGNVVFLRKVDSTNRLARHILNEYVREDLALSNVLVIALEQEAGKGRFGKTWHSPAGQGLYATLLISEVGDASLLPLLIPVALCKSLNRYLHGRCKIKWPNDLLVEGAKLGGILLESSHRGRISSAAVIGFGINHGLAASSTPGSTSLVRELGEDCPGLGLFATELVGAVVECLSTEPDRAEVVSNYRQHLVHRPGDSMTCRLDEEVLSGFFQGIGDDGCLELKIGDTIRSIRAGEIFD